MREEREREREMRKDMLDSYFSYSIFSYLCKRVIIFPDVICCQVEKEDKNKPQ